MIYLGVLLLLVLLFSVLNFQLKLFVLPYKKVRILEYHSISIDGFEDQITLPKERFIQQLEYLKVNGYTTLWFSDLDHYVSRNLRLPKKSVILTFDDGFPDNYSEVLPLLKQYDFKAVCFMVLGRIGKNINWPGRFVKPDTILINKQQMFEMSTHFEFGYHTFKHDNYTNMTFEDIATDLQLCQEVIQKENLKIYPALAYTFGRYYRKKDDNQKQFFEILNKYKIKYALRIGNRINTFPFKSPYEIQRIDIRGNESMSVFYKKIKYGREKLF